MTSQQEDAFEDQEDESEQPEESVEPEAEEPEEPDLGVIQDKLSELERRYGESSKEARRLHEELVKSQERERAYLAAMEVRQRESAPEPRQRWRELLANSGVPEEALPALEGIVEEVSSARARQEAQAALQPLFNALQAQNQIQEELGPFDAQAVNRYLAENPRERTRYDERLTRDPVGAVAAVLYKMRSQQSENAEAGMHAEHEEAQAMKREARKTARITTTKRGAPAESTDEVTEAQLERIKKLAEHGQGTRDYSGYIRERLGMVPSLRRVQWPDADE